VEGFPLSKNRLRKPTKKITVNFPDQFFCESLAIELYYYHLRKGCGNGFVGGGDFLVSPIYDMIAARMLEAFSGKCTIRNIYISITHQ
jgi:hypothetical protein